MTEPLYAWPAQTAVGRRIPKERFTTRRGLSPSVRRAFVDEVDRVMWSHKLAESTLNLRGSAHVVEVQVLTVHAKADDVSPRVVEAIDLAIPSPVILEVHRSRDQRVRMIAALQQQDAPPRGPWFSTDWLTNEARRPLPQSLTTASLYLALLEPLLPATPRDGESIPALAERLRAVRAAERERDRLQRRMNAEPQLNRKMELRRSLLTVQSELDHLR